MIDGYLDNTPLRTITGAVEVYSTSPVSKSGTVVALNNSLEGEPINITLTSDTIEDFTDVLVYAYGKNLFDVYSSTSTIATNRYDAANNWVHNAGSTSIEYCYVSLTNLWEMLKNSNQSVTFSFDIRTEIAGTVRFYTLGGFRINFPSSSTFETTTEWQHKSFTVDNSAFKYVEDSNGDKCNLSWYGTYGTGVKPYVRNIQIEIGGRDTGYEAYKAEQVAFADASGNVADIIAHAPVTTLYAPFLATTLHAECNCIVAKRFNHDGDLVKFQVDRVAEGKLWGYGISQKATIEIRDKDRVYQLVKGDSLRPYLNDKQVLPLFTITDITRDENNNGLTVVAHDKIHDAMGHIVSEVGLPSYNLQEFVLACAHILGIKDVILPYDLAHLEYPEGANFTGEETIREALDDVAELLCCIYYISADDKLVFKSALPTRKVLDIDKTQYFEFTNEMPVVIGSITSATELGDNITMGNSADGIDVVIKDNAFIDLRDDRVEILEDIYDTAFGCEIIPYSCTWRGNYLVELGDTVSITMKNDDVIPVIVLGDSITYDGGYKQKTEWKYNANTVGHTNSVTLGDKLKETFAKVDKQAQRIDLLSSEVTANVETLAAIQLNTDSISASVSRMEYRMEETYKGVSQAYSSLTQRVNATMTAEQVQLSIENSISGIDGIETSTGYTFDKDGLHISKSDSEISTTITEDGMTVYEGSKALLTANNEGVAATDLHAKTYLIIGTNSRFENYGSSRTACFWIGG